MEPLEDPVAALQAAAAQDAAEAAGDESALAAALGTPAQNDPAPTEPVQPGTTPSGDSDFEHGVDINSLPDEAREYALRAERMMKAAMTKRTQEAAPWRKLGDEYGVNAEEAAQALAMWRALDSDPSYGKQLYHALDESLRQQGLLEERSQQQQFADPAYGQEEWAEDPYAAKIDSLEKKLQQFELTERERVQAQYEMDYALQAQRQEFSLRQAHPELTDDALETIYTFAHATNGDLNAAYDRFQYERDRAVQEFIAKQRATAQSQPVAVPPGAHAEVPPVTPNDWKSATQQAREIWAQHLNGQS